MSGQYHTLAWLVFAKQAFYDTAGMQLSTE